MINKIVLILSFVAFTALSCSKKSGAGSRHIPYNVNLTADVEYGHNTTLLGDDQVLKLDVYSPKDASAQTKYPLLVLVHGGSFLTGNKESISDICGALAEKGLIVASIDYRLGWNAIGSTSCQADTTSLNEAAYRAMQDLDASVRYLTANAGKYFIDTNWVFTGGASAGAVAALNSAYLTDAYASVRFSKAFNKLGSLRTADNNLTNQYTVKGICSMWGGVFEPSIINASNAIPTIFYHGSADATIPVNKGSYLQCPNYQTLYGSEYLYNELVNFNVPAVAHIYEGEGHAPPEYVNNAAFVAATTFCFFEALRSKTPQTGMYKQLESNCK